MPRRDPRLTVQEMLDAARKALWIRAHHDRHELEVDWESAYALRLALQITGEAANRLPAGYRRQQPNIPWGEMIGLRNILVHGYETVELDILWQIAEKDLPVLIEQLEQLLESTAPAPGT